MKGDSVNHTTETSSEAKNYKATPISSSTGTGCERCGDLSKLLNKFILQLETIYWNGHRIRVHAVESARKTMLLPQSDLNWTWTWRVKSLEGIWPPKYREKFLIRFVFKQEIFVNTPDRLRMPSWKRPLFYLHEYLFQFFNGLAKCTSTV